MRTAACLLFLALAACDDPAPAGPVTPAPAPTAPPEAAPAPPAEPSPATTSGRRIGRGAPETPPDATALQQARAFREKLREGRQLSKAGRHVEAVAALRRAVELDPSNGPIRCELGWVAFLAGDQATAAEHIDAALVRLEQGGARTDAGRRSLAMCLYNRGRLAEAQNDAARALVLYRKSHRLRENRTVAARIAALESGAPPSAGPVEAATTERQCLVEGCGRVGPFPDVAALGDALEEAVGRSHERIEGREASVIAGVSGGSGELVEGAVIAVTGQGDGEESFVFAALRTARGWVGVDELAYVCNPGIGNIFEELVVESATLEQAIPDGPPELVVRFIHGRSDSDLGIAEYETSESRVLSICGLRGETPTCFTHFPFAESYRRDAIEDADVDPELVSDDLPIESHYTLQVSLSPPGHLTARLADGELDEDERWMVGRHRIEDLAGRPGYQGHQ